MCSTLHLECVLRRTRFDLLRPAAVISGPAEHTERLQGAVVFANIQIVPNRATMECNVYAIIRSCLWIYWINILVAAIGSAVPVVAGRIKRVG